MNGVQAIMPLGQYLFFPDGASLDRNGRIQVDSDASLTGEVSPQIRVPVNEDTVARSMAGEDVQLTYALQWLDGQQTQKTPAAPATTATPTQKSAPAIAIVLLALGLPAVITGRK
jgi:carboxyl-terminal processing protease